MSGNKMLKGAAVIGAAGIMVKVIGAFFRVPLTNWIGQLGMSYYQVAYLIYSTLLVMATAGFPVAISRMVSENVARNRYGNAYKVFRVSLTIMGILGIILSGICYFGAGLLSTRVGNPNAEPAVKAIALALLFVPLLSSFRGFFQGRQNMKPTAVSEIIEQLVRVAVGLSLAHLLLSKGLPQAAAGAAFGASAGAGASLLLMILIFGLSKKFIKKQISLGSDYADETGEIVKKVFLIAIPIIIGAEVVPIMNALDMGIVMRRLQATGWSAVESQGLYGLISAYCTTLINLPQFLIQAIAISLVPAIASASASGNREEVEANTSLGYRLTMMIACPCTFGILALAKPILFMLYPARMEEAANAAPTLMILAISILTLAIYETTTGVLQAIGKQMIPVINVAIGAVVKILISFIFVGIPVINIKGAAAGTVIAYLIASILNSRAVSKHVRPSIDPDRTYIRPIVAAAVMGGIAFLVHRGAAAVLGNSLGTLLAVLAGVIAYGLLVILLKIVTPQELATIPIGARLNRVIGKIIPGWHE
ncbi:MAG: polysaccharide biosynthesis protein [Firmicutes bacterium]|nr:polysaccharide biosynthesis protein [Bacillota bacterium]MCR4710845.1 polysaccharide biosynthesis protein [Clostridia bacterium]